MTENISVKLQLSTKEGNTKAFGSVTAGLFQVNCRVMNSVKGLFVSLPSSKVGEKWNDEVRFTSQEARETVTKAVLDQYNSLVSGTAPAPVTSKKNSTQSTLPF